MTTINQLSAVDAVVSSDQVPIYSSTNGDARKASMNVIKSYILADVSSSDNKVTQYASPSANDFNVAVNNSSSSVWLILTPVDAYSLGTITLPSVFNCVDRQEVLVSTTQSVTSLSVSGNGASIVGEPTELSSIGFFRMRFDAVTQTWYTVSREYVPGV